MRRARWPPSSSTQRPCRKEPNPQDSLGEALIAAGRFKEAEAAFKKALELSSAFWAAHEGIGYAQAYAGDWNGARQALVRARDTAMLPSDKITAEGVMAALALAQRDIKGALGMLDAAAKTAGAQPSDIAFVPVRRALVLNEAGRYREALAPGAAALALADGGQVTAGQARSLRRQALTLRITAEAGLKDAAAATEDVGGPRPGRQGGARRADRAVGHALRPRHAGRREGRRGGRAGALRSVRARRRVVQVAGR